MFFVSQSNHVHCFLRSSIYFRFVMWVSIYNLIYIALERHVALVYPIHYKRITTRHIVIAILLIHGFNGICILPEAQLVRQITFRLRSVKRQNNNCFPQFQKNKKQQIHYITSYSYQLRLHNQRIGFLVPRIIVVVVNRTLTDWPAKLIENLVIIYIY